jgi:hypothetical protein
MGGTGRDAVPPGYGRASRPSAVKPREHRKQRHATGVGTATGSHRRDRRRAPGRRAAGRRSGITRAWGDRGPSIRPGATKTVRCRPEKASTETRLSDLGISHDQSAQWQKLAAMPDDDFDRAIGQRKLVRAPKLVWR